VGQGQSDRFARTGSGSHGTSLTDITRRFAKKGYKAAAYNEGFAFLQTLASPYALLADMVGHAGVPCTEIFDPRWRDVGIGVSSADGGGITTLALEFGRRVGTSRPSTNTKAAATCGHKVPAPIAQGPVVDGRGDPTATATSVTATLARVALKVTAPAQYADTLTAPLPA
jgi:hypothetical protein